ncbi:MAG: 50S ribosomal protein L18 [Chitinispirillia bacterium]|jgi:large subunit ribosomal protein L18
MDKAKQRIIERKKRAFRICKKISGSSERPRLCVKRSLKHISAQLIDDTDGKSIAQICSTSKDVSEKSAGSKTEVSKIVGELIAEKALEKGINRIVFDRKGYPYHGRVKSLAEAVRSKGLKF